MKTINKETHPLPLPGWRGEEEKMNEKRII